LGVSAEIRRTRSVPVAIIWPVRSNADPTFDSRRNHKQIAYPSKPRGITIRKVKAVAAVNSLKEQPDFVMFTGDLTHVTDDDKERRIRPLWS
jgi:hypothetical protein